MMTEELKAALVQANDTYLTGFNEGERVGYLRGYREGFAAACTRAADLIDKTLSPLTEQPKEPS